MIEVFDLKKSFGNKKVLDGVNLTIREGETTCIIGKSGCGKSVLLKHIVGLLSPDSGTVKIDGIDISKMSKKELFSMRSKMGFVFQGAALFDSQTVFENVVIKEWEHGVRDKKYLEDEAKRVLQAVGLLPDDDDKNIFEKEWDILKIKKPSELSGGMRKRVGVARALVGSPDYIFYDEPTTGLDPVTSEQIDELINNLSSRIKATSIVITHDMFSVFKIADRALMLHEGKAIFDGTPLELQNSKNEFVMEFLERYTSENKR